ncbi:MAG: cation diffusion facilitator family transporter [Phycisphaera sp.]|nr:cation diffusion facilitator family transporter [Phycisphaera sp.]
MPEPQAHPQLPQIKKVARNTLIAGLGVMLLKAGVFILTDSAAVLSDALESIINVAAAGMMLYSIHLANRPADRDHPYGHGKVEFMAVGLEGWMILIAGVVIAFEATRRLVTGHYPQDRLELGSYCMAGIALLTLGLAIYVHVMGKKFDNATILADAKHLFTDAFSTLGVLAGLVLVQWTGKSWLDPLVAIFMSALILFTSWRLLWHSIGGLMDKQDTADDKAIRTILDEEVSSGSIKAYHKVRHRHSGSFHWVDMHIQVDPDMNVRDSHALASRIEGRIETLLGQANATAHVEPFGPGAAESNPQAEDKD